MTQTLKGFTKLQLELIKIYSFEIEDQDLIQIKKILGNYFAQKAIAEADKVWDAKHYTNDLMEKWINE